MSKRVSWQCSCGAITFAAVLGEEGWLIAPHLKLGEETKPVTVSFTKVRVDFFRPNQRWGYTGELLWVFLGEDSNNKHREREFAASVRAYCERLDGYKHPNGQYKYKGWTAVCPNPPAGQPLMMKVNDAIKYEEA